MAQIFDPLPQDCSDPILCCYVNVTSKIQVARISNIANWYFERVVFPGQRLMFEAVPQALLEIHTGMMASAILSDTIPCDRLRIQDDPDSSPIAEPLPEPVFEALETKLSFKKITHEARTVVSAVVEQPA
jgi:Domain of unknown function (DUF1830)